MRKLIKEYNDFIKSRSTNAGLHGMLDQEIVDFVKLKQRENSGFLLEDGILQMIYNTVTINDTRELTFERFKQAIKDYEFNKELRCRND